jgi:hypothetical protein
MKKLLPIAFTLCLLGVSAAASDRPRSSYDPAQQQPRATRESFTDHFLKRINPDNTDYGQRIEQMRQQVIDAGLGNLPELLSIVLLVAAFLVIVHQSRERSHREIIAAGFLAWYHNELVRAREVAQDAIARNLTLKNALDEQAGGATTPPELQPASKAGPSITENGAGGPAPDTPKTPAANHDLVAEINQLRQKVEAYANGEKVLQRKINDLDRKLQNEQQKNRSLKGD